MKNDFKFARDALRYIIKNNGVQEIYIPYYLCDVIRHAVFAEGAKPLFYHIDDNFMPVRDAFLSATEGRSSTWNMLLILTEQCFF